MVSPKYLKLLTISIVLPLMEVGIMPGGGVRPVNDQFFYLGCDRAIVKLTQNDSIVKVLVICGEGLMQSFLWRM